MATPCSLSEILSPLNLPETIKKHTKKASQSSLYAALTRCFYYGAEGETRTPTGKPRLDPEPSASTNSTTSAKEEIYIDDFILLGKFYSLFA